MNGALIEKLQNCLKLEFSESNFKKLRNIIENFSVIIKENQKWAPTLEFLEENDDPPTYEELHQQVLKLQALNDDKDNEIEMIKENAIQGIFEKQEIIQNLENEINSIRRGSGAANKSSFIEMFDGQEENNQLREKFLTIAETWEIEREDYERRISIIVASQEETVNTRVQSEIQHQRLQMEKLFNDLRISEELKVEAEKEKARILEKYERAKSELAEAATKVEELSSAHEELIQLHALEKESYGSTINNLRNSSEEAIAIYKHEKECLLSRIDGANEMIERLENEVNECRGRENKILERLDATERTLKNESFNYEKNMKLMKEKLELKRKEFDIERSNLEKKVSELTEEILDVQTISYKRKSTFNKLNRMNSSKINAEEELIETQEMCQKLKSKNRLMKMKIREFERSNKMEISPFHSNQSTDEHDDNEQLDITLLSNHFNTCITSFEKLNALSCIDNMKEMLVLTKDNIGQNKIINFTEEIKTLGSKSKVNIFDGFNKLGNNLSELRRVFHQLQRNQLLTDNCISLLISRAKQLKARNNFLKVSLKGYKKSSSTLTKENSELKKKIEILSLRVEDLKSSLEDVQNDKRIEKHKVSFALPISHPSDNYYVEELRKELKEAQEAIKKSSQTSRRRILEIASAKEKQSELQNKIDNLHQLLKEREELILSKEKANFELLNELKTSKEEISNLKSQIDSQQEFPASQEETIFLKNKVLRKKEKILALREQINTMEFYLANEKRKTIRNEPKDLPRKTLVASLDRLKQELQDMIEINRSRLLETLNEYRICDSPKKGELCLKEKIALLIEDQALLQFSHINFKIDFMLTKSDLECDVMRAFDEAKEAKLLLAECSYDKDRAFLLFKKIRTFCSKQGIVLEKSLENEFRSFE